MPLHNMTMEKMDGLLVGWKEIEAFIGLKREAIIKQGYPVRVVPTGKHVIAFQDEILDFISSLPLVQYRRRKVAAK